MGGASRSGLFRDRPTLTPQGGGAFPRVSGAHSCGSGGHRPPVSGAGFAVLVALGPQAAADALGGVGGQPAPRRSPWAAARDGASRRARSAPALGPLCAGGGAEGRERARLAAPGRGRAGCAVGDRAPRAGAGAAAEPSGRCDHVGPGAQSSRRDVQGGQVLRGGRHRPAGTVPPLPPRPGPVPTRGTGARTGAGVGAPRPGPRRARRPGCAEAGPPRAEQARGWGPEERERTCRGRVPRDLREGEGTAGGGPWDPRERRKGPAGPAGVEGGDLRRGVCGTLVCAQAGEDGRARGWGVSALAPRARRPPRALAWASRCLSPSSAGGSWRPVAWP